MLKVKMTWELKDAKRRFSELLKSVKTEGPQRVRSDAGTVVFITKGEYLALVEGQQRRELEADD